jgi:hypothetical protein
VLLSALAPVEVVSVEVVSVEVVSVDGTAGVVAGAAAAPPP